MGWFPFTSAAAPKPGIKASADDWSLQLHSAGIFRSFTKLGWMNLYAVVLLDGEQVHRTAKGRGVRKNARWQDSCVHIMPDDGAAITIAVRSWNPFGKDVLCGAVTVPLPEDMCDIRKQHFNLKKYSEHTGSVQISLLRTPFAKASGPEDFSHKTKQVVPFDSLEPPIEQQRSFHENGSKLNPTPAVRIIEEKMPLATPRAPTQKTNASSDEFSSICPKRGSA
eukprot:TRINITY_DN27163_c0_g1_i2.p1 TRINITY_DN27163_c0_g1~~TRINITY_DN27163_c0_g1_i2.p1  ORF type:complete len:223 (+),score=41.96 TRINITY_DN27163_c0_g1_i2:179-847(+)